MKTKELHALKELWIKHWTLSGCIRYCLSVEWTETFAMESCWCSLMGMASVSSLLDNMPCFSLKEPSFSLFVLVPFVTQCLTQVWPCQTSARLTDKWKHQAIQVGLILSHLDLWLKLLMGCAHFPLDTLQPRSWHLLYGLKESSSLKVGEERTQGLKRDDNP